MEKARRRHVPAFGEWNYYSASSSPDEPELPASGAATADWWYYAPEPEACSDVWFRYSPPPRKPPPKKARARPGKLYGGGDSGGLKQGSAPPPAPRAGTADGGGGGMAAAERAPAKAAGRRVVRPVDEDLYQVPPPDSAVGKPRRKRAARRLWMGCLGINCVA
ncbi:hypothetical protein ACP4OV_019289 [Aristida adscensionis]